MQITCKCGHTASFDEFTRTPVYGDLPPGDFQCPKCQTAWSRRERGYRLLTCPDATTIIPDRVEILTIERRL